MKLQDNENITNLLCIYTHAYFLIQNLNMNFPCHFKIKLHFPRVYSDAVFVKIQNLMNFKGDHFCFSL